MKKKLLSILAAFIICLSPVLFLAGCTPQEDPNVIMTGQTGWSVQKDQSFASMTVPDDFKIEYKENKYNKETGKYEDVAATPITTLADAINKGLRVISGFDSSTVGNNKKMTVIFGGKYFEITYNVVDGSTQQQKHPFVDKKTNDTETQTPDQKCDTCGEAQTHENHA